jgi:type IV fimbrial biogenesis protein FimT
MLTSRLTRSRVRGFTLIELMTVVAIVAIAAGLAAPGFQQMVTNYRVRGGAEGIINGLYQARAEAVRRNTPVKFTLTGTGTGWTIKRVSDDAVLRTQADGGATGTTAVSSNASTSVIFEPTGLVASAGTQLTQVTVANAVSGTDTRKINIFGGGLIRMCNPAISAGNDPRRC